MASIASMKLGSKSEVFQRLGQTWNCTTGLPSDIIIEIGDTTFHLHKFPLLSRSRKLEKLIGDLTPTTTGGSSEGPVCKLNLQDLPGGAKSFELISKFCYGVKLELNPANVVGVHCAAEDLQMTEDYGENNLIFHSENFLQQLLGDWNDSLQILKTCEDGSVLLPAEQLKIVARCIHSLAVKASSGTVITLQPPVIVGETPRGGLSSGEIWNGINSPPKLHRQADDWWYEDISTLSLDFYKRFVAEVGVRGMMPEFIAESLQFYLKRHLPDFNVPASLLRKNSTVSESRNLVQEIVLMLPPIKGVTATRDLLDLLKNAMILDAGQPCLETLEKIVGAQLDDAQLEDLLISNMGYSDGETIYDVEVVKRIVDHFMALDRSAVPLFIEMPSGTISAGPSPCISPVGMVAKLMDEYLAEVARDGSLEFSIFLPLVAAIPDHARSIHDNLYRAIDIYLQSHRYLTDSEREQLCRLLNCEKLSVEACTHAAQNDRLPLRMIVQVLFFEQLRLRSSMETWFFDKSSSPKPNQPPRRRNGNRRWLSNSNETRDMVNADDIRAHILDLQKECSFMKNEIDKIDKSPARMITPVKMVEETAKPSSWSMLPRTFRLKVKPSQAFCNGKDGSVNCQTSNNHGR